MSGMILHNGAELPGNFAALSSTGANCGDHIQQCLQSYMGACTGLCSLITIPLQPPSKCLPLDLWTFSCPLSA